MRVLIADDHPVVRKGLKAFLRQALPQLSIDEVANGEELLVALREGDCHLLILDIHMGKSDGLATLTEVKRLYPHLPVLVLSMYPVDHFASRALQAGAIGYVMKAEDPLELREAIAKVIVGDHYLSQSSAAQLLNRDGGSAKSDAAATLTRREFQVLRLIGMGKPVKEVAEALGVSPKTILYYKHRILHKLELSSDEQLAIYCSQHKLTP